MAHCTPMAHCLRPMAHCMQSMVARPNLHVFDPLHAGKPVLLRGKASQSSECCGGRPGRAVDGNTNQHYRRHSCTHTQKRGRPWWKLDFGSSKMVSKVQVRQAIHTLSLSDVLHYCSMHRQDVWNRRSGTVLIAVATGSPKFRSRSATRFAAH